MTNATISLVQLAELGTLPDHQYMDEATLRWIEKSNPFSDVVSYMHPSIAGAEKLDLELYAPDISWFSLVHSSEGIHGQRHMCRVAVNCSILGELLQLDEVSLEGALVAACIHDVCRINDRHDEAHGLRASRWLCSNQSLVELKVGRHIRAESFDAAIAGIVLHEKPYENFSPEEQSLYHRHQDVVDVIKTADALDRYRLPKIKWWMNDTLLRVRVPIEVRYFCYLLVVRSEDFYLKGHPAPQCVVMALKTLCEGG